MSNFKTPLIVEHLDGKDWIVREPFEFFFYYCRAKRLILRNNEIERPSAIRTLRSQTLVSGVGEVTDFASIPKFIHIIFSPTGDHVKAAVIHDLIYRNPELINEATNKPFTKEEADLLFLIGMEVLGVSWFKRNLFYQAVVSFGKSSWEENR